MFWRFFSFLTLLFFGAALGYFWGGAKNVVIAWASLLSGALLAGMLWWVLDALRGFRVVSWLRQGDLSSAPETVGLWGEVVDRTRRLLSDRERALESAISACRIFCWPSKPHQMG